MKTNPKRITTRVFAAITLFVLVLTACTPPGNSGSGSDSTAVPEAISTMQTGACLIGTWQVSNYPEYIGSLSNASPAGSAGGFTINDHGSTGTIQMAFNADNTATFTANQFTESLSMVTTANNTTLEIPIEIKENGTSTSDYSVNGDQISFSNQVQGDFTYDISILGRPSALDGSLFGSSGSVTVYQYQCPDANTLSLKVIAVNRDLAPLLFSRVK
jgi:hypothetical protein